MLWNVFISSFHFIERIIIIVNGCSFEVEYREGIYSLGGRICFIFNFGRY